MSHDVKAGLAEAKGKRLLEILRVLRWYKAGKEMIRTCSFQELDLSDVRLDDPHDMSTVASSLEACDYLKKVSFARCRLTDQALSELAAVLKESNLKIFELDISGNTDLGTGGMECVGEIVRHCKIWNLVMRDCCVTKTQMSVLSSSLGDAKLAELDVSLKKPRTVGRQMSVRKVSRPRSHSQLERPPLGIGKVEFVEESPVEELISPIIERVTDRIMMKNWGIGEEDQKRLKLTLNQQKAIGLKLSCGEEETKTVESSVLAAAKSEVTPEGGAIELEACKVTFPANSLEKETKINVSLDYAPPKLDAKLVRVSPVIHCEPSGLKLSTPATFEIKTWLADEPSSGTIVHILHKKDENSDWVWLKSVTEKNVKTGSDHLDRNIVKFECDHFSFFCVVVHKIQKIFDRLFPSKIRVISDVFHDSDGNIFPFFCLADDTLLKKQLNELEKSAQKQLKKTFPFSKTLKIPVDGEVICRMSVRPDDFMVDPSRYGFKVDGDFDSDYASMPISGPLAVTKRIITITYIVETGHSKLFNKSKNITWPFGAETTAAPATASPEPREQTTANFVAKDNSTNHFHIYGGQISAASGSARVENTIQACPETSTKGSESQTEHRQHHVKQDPKEESLLDVLIKTLRSLLEAD